MVPCGAEGPDPAEDPNVPLELLDLIVQPPVLLTSIPVLVRHLRELLDLPQAMMSRRSLGLNDEKGRAG